MRALAAARNTAAAVLLCRRLLHSPPPEPPPSSSAAAGATAGDLCRILSDHRSPHHDLELALLPFSSSSPTSSIVDHVLKRCRNLPDASLRFFLWASRLPSFSPSPDTHLIVVSILAAARRFPVLWSLLSELRDDPSLRRRRIQHKTFWLIFRAYSRAGLAGDAIRAFNRMPSYGIDPDIDDLHKLLLSLCRYNHAGHAQELFDASNAEFPVSQVTYSILMNGWVRAGSPENALRVFDEMLERGIPADLETHNTVIASLCKAGRYDEGRKCLQEMKSVHGLEPDEATHAVFVRAACQAGDVDSAMRALDRMRRAGLVPNVFTYNCIIRLLCEKDRIMDAYELLDEMSQREGAKPDVWSYNAVMAVHCKLKEANRALRLLSRMDRCQCPPDKHTYNMLMKMLMDVGRVDRATEVWKGMEQRGHYPSASGYAVMIHGLCRKKGRIEEACGYFETMLEEGVPPYISTCELLMRQLLRHGLNDQIDILMGKMQRSTSCTIQELSKAMDRRSERIVEVYRNPKANSIKTSSI